MAWVPAWMRSVVFTPPIPIQVASAATLYPLPAVTLGTVQVPETEVKVPPVAAYPAQLLDWSTLVPGLTGTTGDTGLGAVEPGTEGEVPPCPFEALGCWSSWTFQEPF